MANSSPVVLASNQSNVPVTQKASTSSLGTLQSAAAAVGSGTVFSIDGMSAVVYTVSGTFVGTITFEGSEDGTIYSSLSTTQLGTGIIGPTAITTGIFENSVAGLTFVRARVSTFTSGTITVTAHAVPVNFATRVITATQTDGTNVAHVLKADGTSAGQNSQLVASGRLPISFTTTTVQAVATTDVANYRWVSVQVNTQGTSSVVSYQGSNDNVTWFSVVLTNSVNTANTPLASTGSTGIYIGGLQARYFRLNVTGISAGTTAGLIEFSGVPGVLGSIGAAATQSGNWTVQPGNTANTTPWLTNDSGTSATGIAVPTKASYKGLLAQTANPTAATAGNTVGALADKLGKQVVVGSIRDLKIKQVTTITSSTTETTVATAVASTFLDIYGVIATNTSATALVVDFKDSTAGTTQFSLAIPAGDTRGFMLNESAAFAQTTVNTNWTATCSASVASVKITLLAVKNI